MKNKIQTSGTQSFNVPNTAQGRRFLKLLTKFGNHKVVAFRRKGRAKNRKAAYIKAKSRFNYASNRQAGVPLAGADWIAVYVFPRGISGTGEMHEIITAEKKRRDDRHTALLAKLRQGNAIVVTGGTLERFDA